MPTSYIEQQGGAFVKVVNGVFTFETASGEDVVPKRLNGATFQDTGGYQFSHVEPATDGGFVAVMTFDDGSVSLRWFDATGALQEYTPNDSPESYVAREQEIGIDVNGDGSLGAPDATYIEQEGAAFVKVVNGVFTFETASGEDVVPKRLNGATFQDTGGYQFSHVEPATDGGFVAVMTFDDGSVSLRWFDATGALQEYTPNDSPESYVAREQEIGIDVNGDGSLGAPDATYIEQEGAAFVKVVNGVFTFETASGEDVVPKRLNGATFQDTGGYQFSHVEPATDGGFVAVMTFDDGSVSLRWFDATGALQEYTPNDSPESYVAREQEIGIDVNGDGSLGAPDATYIEQEGAAFVKVVNGVFTFETASGEDVVPKRLNGATFQDTGGYQFSHVEPATDGGFVAVMTFDDGSVSLRWFDATGALQEYTPNDSPESYVAREQEIGIDVNGDGSLGAPDATYIEQEGAAFVKVVNGVFTFETASGEDVVPKRLNGATFQDTGGYQFSHVEPATDGGFVAVMTFDDGSVSLRWFDATGALQEYTPNDSPESYVAREQEIGIDVNGDGSLGAPDATYIEQEGAAFVKVVNGVFTFETASGEDVVPKRLNGATFQDTGGYQFSHVEPATDGGFVAVMTFDDGSVSLRWFDATGALQEYTPNDSLESYIGRETEIGIDLNGDGELSAPDVVETIEANGAATLKLFNGDYVVETGSETIALAYGNGDSVSESADFQLLHAEPYNDGFVAVQQLTNGQVSLMYFDAAGSLTSQTAAAALDTYIEQEADLGIDLDGDGTLSEPVVDPEPGQVIDSLGDASLQLTDFGYVLVVGDTVTPVLDENGEQLRPIGDFTIERFADTGASDEYVLVGERPNYDEFQFFILDEAGNFVEKKGPMSEMAAQAYELDLNIEFTGDGQIGRGFGALGGVTPELSGHWGNEGAIRGDTQGNDIVVNYWLPDGTTTESWVDIFGGDGDDILVGGDGENFFFGGKGDDVFYAGDRALNGENEAPQEAIYLFDSRGATGSPWAGTATDGSVYVQDDQGSLMRIYMDGENGWVKDLTSGVDGYGEDTLIGVQDVYIRTDGGTIQISYDEAAGGYVFTSDAQQQVEIENNEWGREGEISGTNQAETINVSTHPAFADFTNNEWIEIEGNGGDDTITGHDGSNWIEGGKGDDTIYGEMGYDTVAYDLFDLNDYSHFLGYQDNGDGTLTVTKNGVDVLLIELKPDNTGTVTDLRSGPENLGTDTLTGIQAIEVEGTVDWLNIQITDDGYKVSGTLIPEISTEPGNGYLDGTEAADTLIANEENGFDSLVFGENSHIWLWGGGGDDTLVGHAGSNWFEGGAGDDVIDGGVGSGWDIAQYTSLDETAFYPFWDNEEGVDFWYREEADGTLTVFVNDQDLYNINLVGDGWIEDLWSGDSDTGYDTVTNLDSVQLETGVGSMEIYYDEGVGYTVNGGYRNIPYAQGWDDSFGSGSIFGSDNSEVINAADFSEVDSTKPEAFIYFEGRGGDDQLIGGASNDQAVYFGDWNVWNDLFGEPDEFGGTTINITEFDFRDNGDGSITVYADGQDLYNLALDVDGNGYVEDLWAADNDSGRDTLSGIDTVEISVPAGSGSMLISVSPEGEYEVSGFIRNRPYAESNGSGDGSGVIYGSTENDVVDAADFPEVNADNEFATISFRSSEGNDVMTGHIGDNFFFTGYEDGDDVMNGGAGTDVVSYDNPDYAPYEQFTQDGRWDAGVRDNGNHNYTLYVDGVDLFSVVFDASFNATVTDLWMDDGNTGVDQLNQIETIWFHGPVGNAQFNVTPGVGVSYFADDYQPDVVDNGDGTVSIVGTDDQDRIIVSDYTELDLSSTSTIAVEGGWGDDVIEGHEGTNVLNGGAGNDLMDGAGGEDTAVYLQEFYSAIDAAPQLSVAVDGSALTISYADYGDLYRVDLAAEYAADAVGETPMDASTALTAGNAVRSVFESEEDVDTFAVNVEAGQTYIIRGLADYSDGQGSMPWIWDVTDEFGNFAGDVYHYSDDQGDYVEFTPYQTGAAFIDVHNNSYAVGDYTLEVLPVGTDTAGETVEVPSEYISGVTVEDLSMLEEDFIANTEHFEFTVDNYSGETSVVGIDQTDTGYDILINGVKSDDVALA